MIINVFSIQNGFTEICIKDISAERLQGFVDTYKHDIDDCYSADLIYTLADKARARIVNYLLALYDNEVINYEYNYELRKHYCEMITDLLEERLDNI